MAQDILQTFLHRPRTANKYDFGHVLVIGGSPGMVGAPLLVAEAALRTGAGLVTIASAAAVIDKLERRVVEVMTMRLPPESDHIVEAVTSFIQDHQVSVVVIGSGLGIESFPLVRDLLPILDLPTVVDAGALAALRGRTVLLKTITHQNRHLVLTPHAGEYKKVTGDTVSERSENQLVQMAERFATARGVTLVLKGVHTLVAHPTGGVYVNETGNPGMATAGAGDALAGVIAGLVAQGATVAQATERGVYLHGLAGDIAAETKSQPGMITSDLIACIPAAFRQLELQA